MINLIIDKDGVAREYDGTYDITIHCETEEEQLEAREYLRNLPKPYDGEDECISRKEAIEAVEFGITYAKAINLETGETKPLFERENEELRKAAKRISALQTREPKLQQSCNKVASNIEQEKMIVESLPSLYPLQRFEEDAIKAVLDALPCWIPCSEGLPKEEGFYLVTMEHKLGAETNIRFLKFENDKRYWSKWGNETITAWMPKPIPYHQKEATE